jgi:hypothetical protein
MCIINHDLRHERKVQIKQDPLQEHKINIRDEHLAISLTAPHVFDFISAKNNEVLALPMDRLRQSLDAGKTANFIVFGPKNAGKNDILLSRKKLLSLIESRELTADISKLFSSFPLTLAIRERRHGFASTCPRRMPREC